MHPATPGLLNAPGTHVGMENSIERTTPRVLVRSVVLGCAVMLSHCL